MHVTGMSGTGKSTVLAELARRGHRVVDTDVGGWIEEGPGPDGAGRERRWNEERLSATLAEHARSGTALFVAGTVWNQGRFRRRFHHVVLLSAPLATILRRVAHRHDNPYGRTVADRRRIAADTARVEPLLRANATAEIDTRAPVAEVVAALLSLTGLATTPPARPPADHRPEHPRCGPGLPSLGGE